MITQTFAARAAVCGFVALLLGCGGGGSGGSSPPPPPANHAPVFTSASTASVAENTAGAFYTASATDADGDPVTFSISGGADAAAFTISAAGALSFAAAPDFEAPADAGADNVYNVTLAAFDGAMSTALALAVTVSNVADPGTRRVASGFSQPLFVLGTHDGSGRVFVLEKAGAIRILNPATGAIAATNFLTVTGLTTDSERGLLGMALAPDYATSGTFYIYCTGANGQIQIRRYQRSTANADIADPAGDVIYTAEHASFGNHNGGWIGFGPDNLLYFGSGDGGSGGDPSGNGQNTNALLGKILRIDPSGDDFPADPNRDYAIPASNPFAAGGGAPEVWLYGLRNPFRNTFEGANLVIADVGQGDWEEIDFIRPQDGGANLGWNRYEGAHPYPPGSAPTSTAGLTMPVAEYNHGTGPLQGGSITGGYVYHGPVASLQGRYIFGDYVNSRIWSIPVSMFTPGVTLTNASFTDLTAQFAPITPGAAINAIASFGVDDAGNLYIIDIGDGEVFEVVEDN
jgi:glucose/arabinose dehydrogenase